MLLFKMEAVRKRRVKDVIAHAESQLAAMLLVSGKFIGWRIQHCREIATPAHFVEIGRAHV